MQMKKIHPDTQQVSEETKADGYNHQLKYTNNLQQRKSTLMSVNINELAVGKIECKEVEGIPTLQFLSF